MGKNIITVYHGSDKIIEKPEFGKGHIYNDYGRGFYLTLDKDLAGEWAVLRTGFNGYINEYELYLTGLNVLDTNDITLENLMTILIKNRDIDFAEVFVGNKNLFVEKYDVDINGYDIIRGIRANDRFYSYMRGFITGLITKEAVERLINLGDWGIQVCLKSAKAFDNIKLIGYTKAMSDIYYENALGRNQTAGNLYRAVDNKVLREGKFITDLI
ncbi:MAG: DUF3990 domain-containing protein [Oscillospiraceae bacterium]|nr:DUF3990 domain-containing protein [Oscillospiraceae bacterium]